MRNVGGVVYGVRDETAVEIGGIGMKGKNQKSLVAASESLSEMMKTLDPYLPKRTFESDPPKKHFERSQDSNIKPDCPSPEHARAHLSRVF